MLRTRMQCGGPASIAGVGPCAAGAVRSRRVRAPGQGGWPGRCHCRARCASWASPFASCCRAILRSSMPSASKAEAGLSPDFVSTGYTYLVGGEPPDGVPLIVIDDPSLFDRPGGLYHDRWSDVVPRGRPPIRRCHHDREPELCAGNPDSVGQPRLAQECAPPRIDGRRSDRARSASATGQWLRQSVTCIAGRWHAVTGVH